MIEDLFAPGRKHTAEEQKRLELSRVDVDGSDPGRGPIDLASGKVTIRPRPVADEEPPRAEAAPAGTEAAPSSPDDGVPPTGAEAEPEAGALPPQGA
ncbi:DUF6191 domain-containing protein [Streptomyces sp. DW26H14]|uniref:DUF6191 domain-containing protein n=1 Tax=Streptomyces sp. DW26H14 TaxID=3435395 RepID=UPI00403DF754